jgi:DNA mismatch repair protein MutS
MVGFTSILSPRSGAMTDVDTPPDCFCDLHLDQIIAAVTAGHADDQLGRLFYAPLHEVSTVEYRHEVFHDLDCDETRPPIENFVAGMATMRRRLHQAQHLWHPLQRQGWFVYAVETFCDAVTMLRNDLNRVEPASRGLRDLAHHVTSYVDSNRFQALVVDTQAVQDQLHNVRYTVHIEGLRVHVDKFAGQPDYSAKITATFERFATEVSTDYHVRLENFTDMDHVEEQILDCVAKLYPETFALLDAYCRRNEHFIEPTIARFEREIHFYLSYREFIRRFTSAGLSFSYPDVTTEPGAVRAEDAFDLALAIKSVDDGEPVVTNNFRLSGPERIFAVTGPNQGGKTTFARTIGQCAYLASLGCPVPASRAELTLPDQIYTHFERQESLSTLHGKLDDELVRIRDILSRATQASIVIMNESFSSTTVDDALLISTEVLERIIRLQCVAVYVTFLDELASLDPTCVSMVGEVAQHDPTQRTFKFTRRPADGLAYAAALADKYGLNHDVLLHRISQ